MNNFRKCGCLFLLITVHCLLITPARAQIPELINYQGRLIRGTNLYNGNPTLIFRMYRVASNGLPVYQETQTVSVVDGFYSTQIGLQSPAAGVLKNAMTNDPLYLEVVFDDTILLPRERFTSVRTAFNADRLDGLNSTAFATGTPLYVYTESDPLWAAVSNSVQTNLAEVQDQISEVSGGLTTETVSRVGADAGFSNQLSVVSNQLAQKLESNTWATAGSTTNAVRRTGDTMSGSLVINDGAGNALTIGSDGSLVQIGGQANGSGSGTAVGFQADANNAGVALGRQANGMNFGAAVGFAANAAGGGAALGAGASAVGSERVAIGHDVNNAIDDSASVRGTLYLDGGTGIFYRATFGSGGWNNLLAGLVTGTPLYVFTETDPLWTAVSNDIQFQIIHRALKTGDTIQVARWTVEPQGAQDFSANGTLAVSNSFAKISESALVDINVNISTNGAMDGQMLVILRTDAPGRVINIVGAGVYGASIFDYQGATATYLYSVDLGKWCKLANNRL